MKQSNNEGFTLVEIVVVVCILAIVGSVVMFIIGSGTTSYTRSSNNADLQGEAQMAINQVQELMIDATNGVSYELDGTEVLNDDEYTSGSVDSVATKSVYVYNQAAEGGTIKLTCSVITWIKSNGQIVYSEYEIIKDVSGTYSVNAIETDSLLAQHVEKFKVDLSKMEGDGIATVEMEFRLKDQSFQASKDITLRNRVVVNKGLEEIYENVKVSKRSDERSLSYPLCMMDGYIYEEGWKA